MSYDVSFELINDDLQQDNSDRYITGGGIGSLVANGQNINHGDTIQIDQSDSLLNLEASPSLNDGYEFVKWDIDGDEVLNQIRVNRNENNLFPDEDSKEEYQEDIESNITIKVYFAKKINIVKINTPEYGSAIVDGVSYDQDQFFEVKHGESLGSVQYGMDPDNNVFTLDKWKIDSNVNGDDFNHSSPETYTIERTKTLNDDNDIYEEKLTRNFSKNNLDIIRELHDSIELDEIDSHGQYYALSRLNIIEISDDNGLDIEIINDNQGLNHGIIKINNGDPSQVEIKYKYELKNPTIHNLNPWKNFGNSTQASNNKLIYDDLNIENVEYHMEIDCQSDTGIHFLKIFNEDLEVEINGQVISNYGNYDFVYSEYDKNEQVEINISDSDDYEFGEWNSLSFNRQESVISGSQQDSSIEVVVDSNLTGIITAFPKPLDISMPDNVSLFHISYSNMQPDFPKMLLAIEEYGYEFIDWVVPQRLQGEGKEVTFELEEGDNNFEAEFNRRNFELLLSTNNPNVPDSSISLVDTNEQNEYTFGETISLKAEDVEGYRFSHWSGDYNSTSKEISFPIGETNNGQLYDSDGKQRENTKITANYIATNNNTITINPPQTIEGHNIENWKEVCNINPFVGSSIIDELDTRILKLNASSIDNNSSDVDNIYTFSHWKINNEDTNKEDIIILTYDINESISYTPVFKRIGCNFSLYKDIDDKKDEGWQDKTRTYIQKNNEDEIQLENDYKKLEYNDMVILRAERDFGYMFKHWEKDGEIISNSPIVQLLIKDYIDVKAVFERQSFLLFLENNNYYSDIIIDPEQYYYFTGNINDFVHSYKYKDKVNILCLLKNNAKFIEWLIERRDDKEEKPKSLIEDENNKNTNLKVLSDTIINLRTDISKLFSSLTIKKEGEGEVLKSPEAIEDNNYEIDQHINLIAQPAPGYNFIRWDGDVESTSEEIDIFLDSDKSVTAIFSKRPAIVSTEIKGSGYILKDDEIYEGSEVPRGEDITLFANAVTNANRASSFSSWVIDGEKASDDEKLEITIEDSITIKAVFESEQEGIFEDRPTKQLRNYRYNGPIESHKYNLNYKENYVDLELAKIVSTEQTTEIFSSDYSEEKVILDYIKSINQKINKVNSLERTIEHIEERIKGGK